MACTSTSVVNYLEGTSRLNGVQYSAVKYSRKTAPVLKCDESKFDYQDISSPETVIFRCPRDT